MNAEKTVGTRLRTHLLGKYSAELKRKHGLAASRLGSPGWSIRTDTVM